MGLLSIRVEGVTAARKTQFIFMPHIPPWHIPDPQMPAPQSSVDFKVDALERAANVEYSVVR
jgi:hypothetical protein